LKILEIYRHNYIDKQELITVKIKRVTSKIIERIKNINAIFGWYNNYFAYFPIVGAIYSVYILVRTS